MCLYVYNFIMLGKLYYNDLFLVVLRGIASNFTYVLYVMYVCMFVLKALYNICDQIRHD